MCAKYGEGRFEADFSCGNTAKGMRCDSGEVVFIKRWYAENDRGRNEIKMSSEIIHESVLKYTDTFVEGGMTYAVRDWIDAVTLSDMVLRGKIFELETALDIAIKICIAMRDIRKQYGSFVHADIRPGNVLYDENSKNIYLIDFETFTLLENNDTKKITGLLERGGYTVSPATEGYTAPEVFKGEICEQSDVYSLGKVLSFLLGICGYDGMSVHKNGTKIPRNVMKIIKKSINSNIEKRQKNAGELLDDLCYLFNAEIGTQAELKKSLPTENVLQKDVSVMATSENKENKIIALPIVIDKSADKSDKKKRLLYIAGNTCFASELSFMMASRMGLKTVLFENGNRIGIGGFDYFIDCRSFSSVSFVSEKKNPFFCDSRHLYLTDEEQWVMRGILTKSKLAENLYLSDCNIFSEFDIYDDSELEFLFNWADKFFDTMVICDSGDGTDELSESLMKRADYIIVPVRPNIDEVYLYFKRYKQLCSKYGIPINRLIFVAWEYEDGISMPVNDFKIAVDNFYGGFIPYDSERLKCKNIKGDFFCEKFSDDIYISYHSLLDGLNLL